jgi:hypothetical protein
VLTVTPTLISDVGVFNMIAKITDTKVTLDYPFKLTVTNQAPQVTGTIPIELILNFG